MKILLFLLFTGISFQYLQAQESGFSNFNPTVYPDRIMLTIPGNPAVSRAISWRTVFSDSVSIGEIAIADASPDLEACKVSVNGSYSAWEEGSQMAMGHKVIFENLKPNTKYVYRVGDGKNWSEWFQLKTSSENSEPFSFLYFGDVQNNIKSSCSRLLRQAYSSFPNADFMLFAGDLVSSSREEYWKEFFYAGGWIFGMVPSVPTPANNSDGEIILKWLDQTLAGNPNRWTVVFTHFPVYSL